jgi:RNA polymerase sigma-70 factor (ECF subfamily)
MEASSVPNSDATRRLLERAGAGDDQACGELLRRYHGRLRRMISVRLDPRLKGRFDPSDVLQETYLDVVAHLHDYLRGPKMPFFLWVRYRTGHCLGRIHRAHLGRQRRDPQREVPLLDEGMPAASSAALAAQLLGNESRPSEHAVKAERKRRLQAALEQMDPIDREVLALRHFEHLSRAESAQVLGLTEAAAAKRYVRALERLREVLALLPGGLEEFR